MNVLIIQTQRAGQEIEIARIYEDGRFKGDQELKQDIEQQFRGNRQQGTALLQAVARSYNNGYVYSSIIEEADGAQSAGQAPAQQPRPAAAAAGPNTRPRPGAEAQPGATGSAGHERQGRA